MSRRGCYARLAGQIDYSLGAGTMNSRGNGEGGEPVEPTTREWARGLVVVLVIAAALTVGGLVLVAFMFGSCGTAYCS